MLTGKERRELEFIANELEKRQGGRMIDTLFLDDGELSRDKYIKHMEFFRLGATKRERLFLAANRVGKSIVGGCESTFHLTGDYPDWWEGRRFEEPTKGWACGTSNEKVKEICQGILLGPIRKIGTGLIPRDRILNVRRKSGVPDGIITADIRHRTGGVSSLTFKSYESGREGFEGTEQDFIWLDEEPPIDVYSECVVRTMTTDGLIMATFTPLKGMSAVVMMFLENGKLPDQ